MTPLHRWLLQRFPNPVALALWIAIYAGALALVLMHVGHHPVTFIYLDVPVTR